ncbi:MAG: alternative ribosome rescue aminoacyl-tRNA hydrolase ArfB [Planctomycetota bacterium]
MAGDLETDADGMVVLAPGVRVRPSALSFSYSSSSGPGGQNVNRRSTKATLRLELAALDLPPGPSQRLHRLASAWLTGEGELVIQADDARTQAQNRRACLDRLRALLLRAMVRPKPRVRTKPSRGAIQRRLDEKKRRGEIKKRRRGPDS